MTITLTTTTTRTKTIIMINVHLWSTDVHFRSTQNAALN